MKEYIEHALGCATLSGATYADVRILRTLHEELRCKNGKLEVIDKTKDIGIGIRVLANGCWGFAASAEVTKSAIESISKLAVKIARASGQLRHKDVNLSSASKIVDTYRTPVKIDPFEVTVETKIEHLQKVEEKIRKVKGVKIAKVWLEFYKKHQWFGNTHGSYIEQEIIESGAGCRAIAVRDGETQTRSYPSSFGQYKCCGYELIDALNLLDHAERIAEQSVALLDAKPCPVETTTVILDGSLVALQVHETLGHPSELDRVLGTEVSLAGTSFLTIDKLNSFQYGSPIVNITADATIPGGLGSFGYDDEGIPAQRIEQVKDGVFVGYLTSRETASVLGLTSNGTMRADGWQNIPLIRMTNIRLEPGNWSFDDMIASTDDGVYLETEKMVSIDDKRLNFHAAAEIGWEIKNGKLGDMLKNPTDTGISYEIWRSCDAIADCNNWIVWGVPSCGKGNPMQIAHVGHGTSPSRFKSIKIGVKK